MSIRYRGLLPFSEITLQSLRRAGQARLHASGSTGSIIATGEVALLARLVRPGLPSDAAHLYDVTVTC